MSQLKKQISYMASGLGFKLSDDELDRITNEIAQSKIYENAIREIEIKIFESVKEGN